WLDRREDELSRDTRYLKQMPLSQDEGISECPIERGTHLRLQVLRRVNFGANHRTLLSKGRAAGNPKEESASSSSAARPVSARKTSSRVGDRKSTRLNSSH